jgi:oxygen-independent coproporphyrinogen III oxidase
MDISLYIHFPFCNIKKCNYCDFYSVPYDTESADHFIQALCNEWRLARKHYFKNTEISIATIYCGGGTPSVLGLDQWEYLWKNLFSILPVAKDVEWTLECNPDSFDTKKLSLWRTMGINRLSLGIQSLHDRQLRLLGRPYSAAEAQEVLGQVKAFDFVSINADIIYGFYPQNAESLKETIAKITSFSHVNHVSAYGLNLSTQSPLGRHPKFFKVIADAESAGFDRVVQQALTAANHVRYEVSNFARAGHECRHNLAYWNLKPYLGLGPAAHSYLENKRLANSANLAAYCVAVAEGRLAVDFCEEQDPAMLSREMIFLGLRQCRGLNEQEFTARTGEFFYNEKRKSLLDELCEKGLMRKLGDFWALSDTGMLIADAVAARLF